MNVKTFIITLIASIILIVLIIKLMGLPKAETVSSSNILTTHSNWDSEHFTEGSDLTRYSLREQKYGDNLKEKGLEIKREVNNQKLQAYAKAYVLVQFYMNRVGSKASYKETTKIVKKHGLSVEDYTRISILMNESSIFRENVQELINEVEDSTQ